MKKYVLPEGVMDVEFEPHMWQFLENGVLDKVEIVGKADLNTGGKATVRISAKNAFLFDEESEKEHYDSIKMRILPGGDHENEAMPRIMVSMMKYIMLATEHWIIVGFIKSRNGKSETPIVLSYSRVAGKAFYSIKRGSDTGTRKVDPNFHPERN